MYRHNNRLQRRKPRMESVFNSGDVTVNGPKDDLIDQDYDIFWFRKEDDQEFIGRIVKEAISRKEQAP